MVNASDQNGQTFLLRLSDSLRAEISPQAVGQRATQLMAQQFRADRVYLVSLNPHDDTVVVTHETRRPDLPPLQGAYYSSDFPAAIQEIFERTIVYTDVRTDARLTDLDRRSFAGLGAVGFIAASLRLGSQTIIWAAGAVATQPRSWTEREVALFEHALERTWAALERARTEDALRQSEAKYHSLFESADEGFHISELIYNEAGQAVDWRFLEVNQAFERQTGLHQAAGRLSSEIAPSTETYWLNAYQQVVQTGQPVRLENYNQATSRWYSAYATRVGPAAGRQFAVVFTDVTERRRYARQQNYLLDLSEALRSLADPVAIEETITRIARQYFEADRCYYCRIENGYAIITRDARQSDLPSVAGTYLLSNFALLKQVVDAGQPFVVNDAATTAILDEAIRAICLQLQVISFVDVPVIKNGQAVGVLCVVQATPRHWTQTEIQLAVDTAERTWAAVERANAEETLRQSMQRFESIANLVPDLLWDSEPDGSTNWYNQRWLDYTGQRFEQAIGWGWTDAIHPDDREGSVRRYSEAVLRGQPVRLEERIRRYDGTYRWFMVNASPVKDQQGNVIKMYGAATDIDDRKQAEERIQTVLESLPMIVSPTRPDGLAEYVNQEWTVFSGRPAEDFISGQWVATIHPDDRDRVMSTWTEALASGQPYEYELRALAKGGRYRWLQAQGLPLTDTGGTIIRWINTALDIHDRKEAEEALREADRRKDEFLAMLAHELRNPMSTLRSGLSILTLTTSEDERNRSTVAMMSRQTDHLVRMVDDLLDVSRISRGTIELRTERVDVVALVHQVVESMQSAFEQQGKVLQVSLPIGVLEVTGDPTRLTQVVINLLTNGLRYTGDGGQVWVSLIKKDSEALLQVRDNGIGLAADQLAAIFELFVQVDNSTARSKGGLGLGLTLVKRLVELHGGRVEANSQGLGQGSTFTVYLPTLAAAKPLAEPAPPAPDHSAPWRVLVIDDNADAAMTLGMLLKLKGYEAHTRTSGRAGIEAAKELQPAAILLDIGMPELDGYATCRLIREQAWGQDLIVIALTGYGQDEDRERTKEAGFDRHLVKPVEVGTLTKMLTDLLGTK